MALEQDHGALALDTGEFLETEISPEERRPERQYCVFRAGRERFCLNVLEVEEVVDWPIVTRIPLAPAFLMGVFNLRGTIVPLMDIAFTEGRRPGLLPKHVVVAAIEGDTRKAPCKRVGGKHMPRIAVTVSWKLIKQHHEGERAFGGLDPIVQLTRSCSEVQRLEALAEVSIERFVFREPFVDTGLTPEAVHRGDARIDCSLVNMTSDLRWTKHCFGHCGSAPAPRV